MIKKIFLKNFVRNFSSYIDKKTPLFELQKSLSPKYGDFAGYQMPLTFGCNKTKDVVTNIRKDGIGIFDVSHMGIINLVLKNSNNLYYYNDSRKNYISHLLERIFPANIKGLKENKSVLSILLNNRGYVIDDLIISNINNMKYRLVVNANTKFHIRELIYQHIKLLYQQKSEIINGNIIEVNMDTNIILAIQGKNSSKLLTHIFNFNFEDLYFNDNVSLKMNNNLIEISRCGYTGEDGFEIYCGINYGKFLYKKLIELSSEFNIFFGGLIERDILRLESGLCLSGNEFSNDMSVCFSDIDMNFLIGKRRRTKKNFVGEIGLGLQPIKKRVGFLSEKPIRNQELIYCNKQSVGYITSSTKSYNLNKFISMGYIKRDYLESNNDFYCIIRDKNVELKITDLPFVKHNYRRKI